ncbi:MAG: hypothetical protein V7K34_25070 [Nostoc sp.]
MGETLLDFSEIAELEALLKQQAV